MTPILITIACMITFGLAVWWSLPKPAPKTRHRHNVLARVEERRTHVLVYRWLHRPETERA